MPKKRTLKSLSKELIDNPFFPLLFIAEVPKQYITGGPWEQFGIIAVVAVVLWVLSDAIDAQEVIGDGGEQR